MTSRWTLGACALVALVSAVASSAGGCFYPSYEFDGVAAGGGGAGATSTDATTSTTSTTATTGTASTTATTSSSSGGGSSTATTTAATSTTSAGGEDCLNGIDDDGDNAIDCADTDCEPGFTCVEDIPTGWGVFGYVALAQALPGQEPACPADYPDEAYTGSATPIAPPATCSMCTCGAPSGQKCTLADMDAADPGIDVVQISNKPCGQQPVFVGLLEAPANWDGTCYGTQGYLGGQTNCGGACNVSVSANPAVVTGGTCAVSGGQATVDPLTFAVAAKACGGPTTGGGCGATQACLPRPAGGFESGVCIGKVGDDACPSPFDVKFSFTDPADAMDDRDCAPCGCDVPTGSSCQLSIQVYSDQTTSTCNTNVTSFMAGQCTNVPGNPAIFSKKLTVLQQPSGGSCGVTAGGGQPTGSVTLGQPTTICCTSG